MNRRGFIASIAALAVAPFVPTPAETGLSTFNVATKQWTPAAVEFDSTSVWFSPLYVHARVHERYGYLPFEYDSMAIVEVDRTPTHFDYEAYRSPLTKGF